jgi:hypothetical protein
MLKRCLLTCGFVLFARLEFASASVFYSLGYELQGGNFTAFSYPGAITTSAQGINNSGDIAGYYFDGTASHGFIMSGGTFTSFDLPGFYNVTGINDADRVVGNSYDGSNYHGFVKDGGTITSIDFPGAISTTVTGINHSGLIVGSYWNGSRMNGFTDSGGTFTSLSYGGFSTFADGVNNVGDVMGTFDTHGFIQNSTSFTSFDFPNSGYQPSGINDADQIVGSFRSFTAIDDFHGFLKDGNTYTTIDFPVTQQFLTGTFAFGINDEGEIVGRYEAVPEPQTQLLLAVGLASLFALRRRLQTDSAIR